MTEPLFRDAYLRAAESVVTEVTDAGVVCAASVFYPTGGGQPGDGGTLDWDGGTVRVVEAVKGAGGAVVLRCDGALPPVGAAVVQRLDWETRLLHMRMHTALHLLSVAIPLPVTGGAIGAGKGRLDFDMAAPPEDKAALEAALMRFVDADLPVTQEWITEAELDANPALVKTLRVAPPRGAGRVRLVRIGAGDGVADGLAGGTVDLQPCGGTHVARTGEIGALRLGKVEKKGAQNRRVYLHLA